MILESGEWPDGWTESMMIPLPKKGGNKNAKITEQLALLITQKKVLLNILLSRMKSTAKEAIDKA